MPKLPTLTAQSGGPITQGEPGVFRLPPVSPESTGAGLARGLAEMGQAFLAVDSRLRDQRDRIQLSEMSMQLAIRLDEAHARILTDAEIPFEEKPARLAEETQTMLREIEEEHGGSNAVRSAFRAHGNEVFSKARLNIAHAGRQQEAEQQLVDSDRLNEWKIDRAAAMPLFGAESSHSSVASLGQQVEDLIQSTVKNGLRRPEAAAREQARLQHRYWEQYATNYPDHMKALLETGAGDHPMRIDPSQVRHYGAIADQAIRGREAEAERARKEQERQLKAAQMATQNTFIEKLTQGTLTTKEILSSNLDPVGQGSKEHYIGLLESRARAARQEQTFQHDPAVFARTLDDIRKFRITTEEEIEQVFQRSVKNNRGITWEDAVKLRAEVDDMRTPEGARLGKVRSAFLSGIEASINKSNPLMGILDPSGRQKFYEFSQYVDDKVNAYRQERKDPHVLFDPKSPEYLGAPGVLVPFQKTTQESMKDVSQSLKRNPIEGSGTPPRLEGETPAQYLERTKK